MLFCLLTNVSLRRWFRPFFARSYKHWEFPCQSPMSSSRFWLLCAVEQWFHAFLVLVIPTKNERGREFPIIIVSHQSTQVVLTFLIPYVRRAHIVLSAAPSVATSEVTQLPPGTNVRAPICLINSLISIEWTLSSWPSRSRMMYSMILSFGLKGAIEFKPKRCITKRIFWSSSRMNRFSFSIK